MSANDFDEDLKSELVYDTEGRKINDELGNKIEYEVVDDDYRPEKERTYQRLSGEQNVEINLKIKSKLSIKMTWGEWIITGVVFGGLLIPAGIIKLSLLWTDFRVEQVKKELKKNDISEEERQLIDLLIEDYEEKKKGNLNN